MDAIKAKHRVPKILFSNQATVGHMYVNVIIYINVINNKMI